MTVGYRRLFLHELDANHLRLLIRAVESTPGASGPRWLEMIDNGTLRLWDVGDGLIGLVEIGDVLWIEVLVGQGLIARRQELFTWLQSFGMSLEANVHNRALLRVYHSLGFRTDFVRVRHERR